ncbi:hypothetical protein HO173_009262 [Letharia columbiana]|uniref:Uncharacterized protein n=1 Tax=Letharia columbiana TaxID=112416 RepID=A0A8H6FQ49_9LECA|nr:uncharacterized protein HO173_009262 [Letharia columbiana]KAF6232594.1 hypothetical protein HO173_009262 [Letharia columbiana]
MENDSALRAYKYHLLTGAYILVTAGALFRVYRQPYNRNMKIDQIETIFKATTLGAVIAGIGLSGKINKARSAQGDIKYMQSDSARGSQQIFQGRGSQLTYITPRILENVEIERNNLATHGFSSLLRDYSPDIAISNNSPIIFWKSDIANICDRMIFSPFRILQSISKMRRARFNAKASVSLATDSLFKPGVFVQTRIYQPLQGRVGQCIKNLDFSGIILFVGASVSLVMGIAFGGAVYTWKNGQIIGQFFCSGILKILLGLQQSRSVLTTKENSILPVQFLKTYEMCILFAQVAVCIASGIRLLPFVFGAVLRAMINGVVLERYSLYMPWFTVGGVLIASVGGLLYTISPVSSAAKVYGYSVITAIGTGFFGKAPFSGSPGKSRSAPRPLRDSVHQLWQVTGVSLSLSIATSISINQSTDKIALISPNATHSALQALIAWPRTSFFRSQNRPRQQRARIRLTDAAARPSCRRMVIQTALTAPNPRWFVSVLGVSSSQGAAGRRPDLAAEADAQVQSARESGTGLRGCRAAFPPDVDKKQKRTDNKVGCAHLTPPPTSRSAPTHGVLDVD